MLGTEIWGIDITINCIIGINKISKIDATM